MIVTHGLLDSSIDIKCGVWDTPKTSTLALALYGHLIAVLISKCQMVTKISPLHQLADSMSDTHYAPFVMPRGYAALISYYGIYYNRSCDTSQFDHELIMLESIGYEVQNHVRNAIRLYAEYSIIHRAK